MQSEQWQLVQTYADQTSLQIAAQALKQQQIEIFLESDQPIVGLDLGGRLYVRPELRVQAEQVLGSSTLTDAELSELALSSPTPSDA